MSGSGACCWELRPGCWAMAGAGWSRGRLGFVKPRCRGVWPSWSRGRSHSAGYAGLGGGRKRLADVGPGLRPALLALVEPQARGDPESPLRWTTTSTRRLADRLRRQGHRVSADVVAGLLREEGFSLQANAKTIEGTQHPDRDGQFRYINDQVKAHQDAGDPVISVDTKKKELIGPYANGGREWRPARHPAKKVKAHDFPDAGLGKAIPYGIYDMAANRGWVSVGTDHDTAAFAVESLRRWWMAQGRSGYPGTPRLLVTADAGGSNSYRTRAWKTERRIRRPERAGDHGVPLPARHLQVEHGRTPVVLPYHDELAGAAPDQPRSRRQHDRGDHHPHRAAGGRRARHRQLPHRYQGQ